MPPETPGPARRRRRRAVATEASDPPPAPPARVNLVMAFGSHEGAYVRDVPTPYLAWVLAKVDMPPRFKAHIREVLAERGHAEDASGIFSFGRYAGRSFDEVPLSYLSWALDNIDRMSETDRQKIRATLAEADYPEHGHLSEREREAMRLVAAITAMPDGPDPGPTVE